MWCGKCQSEVAAEVSPDNQRVFCAACGTLLSTIDVPPARPAMVKSSDRTKDARELLQRWSSGNLVDPFGPPISSNRLGSKTEPEPVPDLKSATPSLVVSSPDSTATAASIENAVPNPVFPSPFAVSRSDSLLQKEASADSAIKPPETGDSSTDRSIMAVPNPLTAVTESAKSVVTPGSSPFAGPEALPTSTVATAPNPSVVSAIPRGHFHRVDSAHPPVHFGSGAKATTGATSDSVGPFASVPNGATAEAKRPKTWLPTWDPAVWRSEPNETSGWSSLAGQFLAYAGVLGMTAGACMVVWSYFGGPANYAPTGWLLATAGQMLLFFGVVTLVSGGLEQTTEQVNKRIEQLGDHIIRIEQAAREMSLRSGSVPAAHFGGDHDTAAAQRSMASSNERSVIEK